MIPRTIRSRVEEVILHQAGCEPERVIDAADLRADIGLDSLDMVEFYIALEEEFDTSLPDAECDALNTVGDAVALMERRAPHEDRP